MTRRRATRTPGQRAMDDAVNQAKAAAATLTGRHTEDGRDVGEDLRHRCASAIRDVVARTEYGTETRNGSHV